MKKKKLIKKLKDETKILQVIVVIIFFLKSMLSEDLAFAEWHLSLC